MWTPPTITILGYVNYFAVVHDTQNSFVMFVTNCPSLHDCNSYQMLYLIPYSFRYICLLRSNVINDTQSQTLKKANCSTICLFDIFLSFYLFELRERTVNTQSQTLNEVSCSTIWLLAMFVHTSFVILLVGTM